MQSAFVVDPIVAPLVALIVQYVLKPLIELWLSPDAPHHDDAVRAGAVVLGVALVCVETLIGAAPPATGQAWLLLLGAGIVSGLGAIGLYHSLSGPLGTTSAGKAPTPPAAPIMPPTP